jgi:hypothetical protein
MRLTKPESNYDQSILYLTAIQLQIKKLWNCKIYNVWKNKIKLWTTRQNKISVPKMNIDDILNNFSSNEDTWKLFEVKRVKTHQTFCRISRSWYVSLFAEAADIEPIFYLCPGNFLYLQSYWHYCIDDPIAQIRQVIDSGLTHEICDVSPKKKV